jgi:hypothetical protein
MHLHSNELSILRSISGKAGVSPEDAWSYSLTAVQAPEYNTHTVNGRDLQVPTRDLALAHKLFNAFARLHLPASKGIEEITASITDSLSSKTPVIRTDISNCFGSLKFDQAQPLFLTWLSGSMFSIEVSDFLRLTFPSIFPTEEGLSTGSPASPVCLDIIFTSIELPRGCYRYVDDFLFVDADPKYISDSFHQLSDHLQPLGWNFSTKKTAHLNDGEPFTFLGIKYRSTLPPAQNFSYDLHTLVPVVATHDTYQLTTDSSADSYRKTKTSVIYSAFTLADQLSKGSVDALLTVWQHYVASPEPIQRTIDGLLSQDILKPIHSNLWRIYVKSVKTPRDAGKVLDLQGAERVLLGLALDVFLASTARFPVSLDELEQHLTTLWPLYPKARKLNPPSVSKALAHAATGDGDYHTLISAMFKVEWQLREGHKSCLPDDAPYINHIMEIDDLPPESTPFTHPVF